MRADAFMYMYTIVSRESDSQRGPSTGIMCLLSSIQLTMLRDPFLPFNFRIQLGLQGQISSTNHPHVTLQLKPPPEYNTLQLKPPEIDSEIHHQPQVTTSSTSMKDRQLGSECFEHFSTWDSLLNGIASLIHVACSFKSSSVNLSHKCTGWHQCEQPHLQRELVQAKNVVGLDVFGPFTVMACRTRGGLAIANSGLCFYEHPSSSYWSNWDDGHFKLH